MARNQQIEKASLSAEQFEELDSGLMEMFRTCVARQGGSGDRAKTREAGARVAEAIMQLHRNFKPGR